MLLRGCLIFRGLGLWDNLGLHECLSYFEERCSCGFHCFRFYFLGCWCTVVTCLEMGKYSLCLGTGRLFTSFFKYSIIVLYTRHRSSHLSVIPFYFYFIFMFMFYFILFYLFFIFYFILFLLSFFLEYGAKFGACCFSDRCSTSGDGQGNRFVRLFLVYSGYLQFPPHLLFLFFDHLNSVCWPAGFHASLPPF